MPIVYAAHPFRNDRINVKDAERFGVIKYVNEAFVYTDDLDIEHRIPQLMNDRLWDAVTQFNYEQDYLLIAGDYLQIVVIAGMLGSVMPYFYALRWDQGAKRYIPVKVCPGKFKLDRPTGS